MTDRDRLVNFRLWLGLIPTSMLGDVAGALRDEAVTRLQLDAANYFTKGIACLDVLKVGDRAIPAIAEPPASK